MQISNILDVIICQQKRKFGAKWGLALEKKVWRWKYRFGARDEGLALKVEGLALKVKGLALENKVWRQRKSLALEKKFGAELWDL